MEDVETTRNIARLIVANRGLTDQVIGNMEAEIDLHYMRIGELHIAIANLREATDPVFDKPKRIVTSEEEIKRTEAVAENLRCQSAGDEAASEADHVNRHNALRNIREWRRKRAGGAAA